MRLDPAINTAEVQQARANLTLAKAKYDRAADLADRNFISGQAKDEVKNSRDVAEAPVARAEAKLAKMELKVPFAGIIGMRVVSIGDYNRDGVLARGITPHALSTTVSREPCRRSTTGLACERVARTSASMRSRSLVGTSRFGALPCCVGNA